MSSLQPTKTVLQLLHRLYTILETRDAVGLAELADILADPEVRTWAEAMIDEGLADEQIAAPIRRDPTYGHLG